MKKVLIVILGIIMTFTSAYADELSVAENTYKEDLEFDVESTKKVNNRTQIKETVYIKNIEIEGTNVIKPEDVMSVMQMQRGDEFSRDLIQADLKSIYNLGSFTEHMKAIPITNADGSITLKIVLEENTPIVDYTLDGNSAVSTDELMTFLEPLRGQPQNIQLINEAIEKIQECYASKGYILARVDALNDDPDGTINVHISEGKIDRIKIQGNEKTKDYVIARNILTEAGGVYNENQIKEDLVRLYATQAFKDVRREIEVSDRHPDMYDVTICVEEQRSASLSVGAGLDSATGLFGSAGIVDNNFRGLNQRVGLNLLAGSGLILNDSSVLNHMNLQAELSFFEPYFINADNSFMGKIFFRDFGSYQIPLAIERRFGAEATVSHKVKNNKNLRSTFSLGLEHVKVEEGDDWQIANLYYAYGVPISERAKQLEGGLFLSLSPGLTYDTRDNLVNPRAGVYANVRFDESVCVDKFENSFGKLTGSIKKYVAVGKKSSLSLTARAGGNLWGNMPEVMAYHLGGPYSIRGFKMSGVGTGNAFVMGSAELAVPIPFMDKLKFSFMDNVRLTMFVDAGKIFGESPTNIVYERPMQAISAGLGLKLFIPGMGPLSIDYGIPLTNPGDKNSKGYFTFGIGDMMY